MTSPEHDDLDQAYAQAHALADDGRGPAASVRANVLAAALQVAAQAAPRAGVPPEVKPTLVPVAAPVSDVARGRSWALNLSSWRVRSGAALCAVLIVGLACWRFDASRRFGGEMQVASAGSTVTEMKVVEAPPRDLPPPPKNLPVPMSASPAYAPAPPMSVDAAPAPMLAEPAAEARVEPSTRERDVVVQAGQAYRANSMPAPRTDAGAGYASPPAPATARVENRLMDAARAAPAPAPVALAAAPAAAAASSAGNVVVAAADAQQRVEITGSSIRSVDSPALRGSLEQAKKAAPAPVDKLAASSLRALPLPLHAAAGSDDVDTLRKLLANPATRVDAPDAQGRTPLLLAVAAQHVAAVRLLLAAGADPDHADQDGATPRSVARTGANAEIATLLAVPR